MREPAAVVWVVDADHWPRAYLRAELIERGLDAIGFPTLRDALAALPRAGARRPRLLVVDLDDQSLDDRLLLVLRRSRIPALGVAGTAAAAGELVRGFPWAALLRRPVTLGAIADAVERRLVSAGADPPAGRRTTGRGRGRRRAAP